MRILITGASGFTGHHLIAYLLSLPDPPALAALYNRSTIHEKRCVRWIQGDITNRKQILDIISDVSPDAVIHLAGASTGNLEELVKINVLGTENLLDAILQKKPDCRILVVGSSAEYGYAGSDQIREDTPLRPVGAYGVSKVAEDLLAQSYFLRHQLSVAVVRPFNLIGPGQSSSFVCGKIVEQITLMEKGLLESIQLGNIDSFRDFIDVRDVVSGFWHLISHEEFPELFVGKATNIGSGKATSIREVVNTLEKIINCQIAIQTVDYGPDRVPTQMSNNSWITSNTMWKPEISLEHSLQDMITEQRRSIGDGTVHLSS
jgi:GDP-4-dehydro-6-deoxy-D-mannose reductase